MILIFKEQTFKVQQLHSYNSKSFIVDIVCDETNLFPTEFEEEDYMELFSKEDQMKLKTIYFNDYQNFLLELITDNIYKLSLTQEEKKEEETITVTSKEVQIEQLKSELKEQLKMGIMFPTPYGIQRFSFEEHDQQNLSNAYIYLTTHPEVEEYYYHANGETMQLFPRETLLELNKIMIEFVNEKLIEYHIKKQKIN